MASGVLFVVQGALALVTGPPPRSGTELVAWVATNDVPLAFLNETLFVATVLLIPGLNSLYERTRARFGCGLIATTIPLLFALLIVHGRLVFPVYGLRTTDAAGVALVVGVFYGGLGTAVDTEGTQGMGQGRRGHSGWWQRVRQPGCSACSPLGHSGSRRTAPSLRPWLNNRWISNSFRVYRFFAIFRCLCRACVISLALR